MNRIFNKFIPQLRYQNVNGNYLQRHFCKSKVLNQTKTYEGDGKTKVNILNKELDIGLMINSYNQFGFRLNNEMVIIGPMAIFPRCVLSWNVVNHTDINEDSLSLFSTIEPKLDVLVIGLGDEGVNPDITRNILGFMRKYKINVEILRTDQACATFNFLNAEKRMVAAAMIPPRIITVNENDVLESKRRKNELYRDEN